MAETLDERRAAVEARGIRFVHEPIVDMDAPGVARMQRLVDGVLAELDASRNVLVHCWAGLGRAGTVAACTLVARGLTPQLAVARLRRVRPGAVQSVVQERLVWQFGEAVAGRGTPAP
jgi:protein-tyrosine phosphatase